MLAERCAISAGVSVTARFFTQSMNCLWCPGLLRRISPASIRPSRSARDEASKWPRFTHTHAPFSPIHFVPILTPLPSFATVILMPFAYSHSIL